MVAYLCETRDRSALQVALFSDGAGIEVLDAAGPGTALDEIRTRLAGVPVIAEQAARLEEELVQHGFVQFRPVDAGDFSALFGTIPLRSSSGASIRERAESVAERIDWLVSRGSAFNRQLESWATTVDPALQRLFAAIAEEAEQRFSGGAEIEQTGRARPKSRNAPSPDAADREDVTLEQVFGSDGSLGRVILDYERREGQQAMASAVGETLGHDGVLLVEAGTGIGKSLAYLVPAALWAQQQGEPVIVSTFTRGLQEQLVNKDVPLASAAIEACGGAPVQGVALKGRSNYLCLRRWMQESRSPSSDPVTDALKIKISIWLEWTTSGDRAELSLTQAEDRAFSNLSASADNCMQIVCRSSLGNRCFFTRSRLEAQQADLIVMNHALLFASLGEDNSVLGNLDKLVIDEAHHLESVATSQFSFAVSGPRIDRALSDYAALQGNSIVGHCGKAVEALSAAGALRTKPANARRALELLRSAVSSVERGKHWAELFFQAAARLVEDQDDAGSYSTTRRILPSTRDQPNWQTVRECWEALDTLLAEISGGSRWLIDELGNAARDEDALDKVEPALLDLSTWRRDLEELQVRLRAVVEEPDPGFVYWIAGRRSSPDAAVYGAPLDVAELVAGELLERTSSAILASATLRSQGSFQLIRQQLGIADADELVLPSPFDYRSSTLLYIARDVPDPRHADYLNAVGDAIQGLSIALGGRTLALFTSHAAIRSIAPGLREQLSAHGITVLAQDIDGTPNQLVERMKRQPSSVVLGVAAFWEGVDVPGDELSGLVVTRLPFDVPTDPLFAARSELYEHPFQQFSLPRAALKFRQGFGRLIRTSSDRGIVVVLDNRIFTKSYGSTFIRAIPECTVRHGTVADLGEAAERWLRIGGESR